MRIRRPIAGSSSGGSGAAPIRSSSSDIRRCSRLPVGASWTQGLALDGLDRGHFAQLATVWEKTFFVLPLGHSEQIALLERCVALCDALVDEAPEPLRNIHAFSASQARGHRDVIARFGRYPHRNAVLVRTSTEDERAYLASGELVHRRSFRG
jgi:uncharacterized protein (DUF924 family)